MAIFHKILKAPHPFLFQKALPVTVMDDKVQSILDGMLETMYAFRGVGLAANQVGVGLRLVVMDVSEDHTRPLKFINPVVTWTSATQRLEKEGCLSVPTYQGHVERPDVVKVSFLNGQGHPEHREFQGLAATCIQHEIDHLNGILFIDHLSSFKRSLALKKMSRVQALSL